MNTTKPQTSMEAARANLKTADQYLATMTQARKDAQKREQFAWEQRAQAAAILLEHIPCPQCDGDGYIACAEPCMQCEAWEIRYGQAVQP